MHFIGGILYICDNKFMVLLCPIYYINIPEVLLNVIIVSYNIIKSYYFFYNVEVCLKKSKN